MKGFRCSRTSNDQLGAAEGKFQERRLRVPTCGHRWPFSDTILVLVVAVLDKECRSTKTISTLCVLDQLALYSLLPLFDFV